MIRRTVKLQLVAFTLISAFVIVYAGFNLIGLNQRLFGNDYKVRVNLVKTGGIFATAEVTYRGVSIGRVESMQLTKNGVDAVLRIRGGEQVPADTEAVVANLSAVGQQYIDLQPRRSGAPFLADGDVITVENTRVPPLTIELLTNLNKLVNSVNQDDLRTVIDELGVAFDGTGPTLARLIDSGNALTKRAEKALPETIKLIQDSAPVLETQRVVASDLKTYSQQLAQFSQQLRASDPDLRRTIDNGTLSAAQLDDLLKRNEPVLPVLLANLTTLGQIQAARLPNIEAILVLYPINVAAGFTVVPGDGTSHFGLATTDSPAPCTQGYESTSQRQGTDTTDRPANVFVDCGAPAGSQPAIRGARSVPRPAGDTTGQFGGSSFPPGEGAPRPPNSQGGGAQSAPTVVPSSTSGPAASSSVVVADYDRATGRAVMPDGSVVTVGNTGEQSTALGSDSWKWLLVGPLAG